MLVKQYFEIFMSPQKGWSSLLSKPVRASESILILVVQSAMASGIVFAGVTHSGSSWQLAALYFTYNLFKWSIGIMVCSWAISRLALGFKGNLPFTTSLPVVSLSSLFLIVCSSLSYVFPTARAYLMFFSLVSIVYLFLGVKALSGVNPERLGGFILISLLVFALVLFITQFILAVALGIPINI